ncbi:hypothetical protein DM02DRAFT_706368 [Periconia macrospinosa]|uniref:Uncharacterized protein n=1 Tax=Periconia macrospinosa TaxID=97972 RepID=A0A2V1DV74_9PLEO|nr:hypothetical protein DM02DRAFT_706368 [Periconia macrospinosa]
MSIVLVTLTDTVIDNTPTTLITRVSSVSPPTTTSEHNVPTSNPSAQATTTLSPTSTELTLKPTTAFPQPTRQTSSKGGDNTIIVMFFVVFLLLAIAGLGALGFFIWRFWKGYCPGCTERDKRIKFLEKGDPIPAGHPETGHPMREFSVYDQSGNQEANGNSGPSSTETPRPQRGNIPPTSGLAPPPPPPVHVKEPVSRWSESTRSPQQPKRASDPDSLYEPGPAAPQAKDAPGKEMTYDCEKTNPIYDHYKNGYHNPYDISSESSISSYNRVDEPPKNKETNPSDAKAKGGGNQSNPYCYPGLNSPPSERAERPPPKPPAKPQVSETDLVKQEMERRERVREHRRTGGYGGFEDVDLSSPTKESKDNWI